MDRCRPGTADEGDFSAKNGTLSFAANQTELQIAVEVSATQSLKRMNAAAGTAITPSDFEHKTGMVTFAPGETSRTIIVRVAGDAIAEETETFTLSLSNSDGAVISDASATCTIRDDDKSSKRRSVRP